jgi:hypothetical protein
MSFGWIVPEQRGQLPSQGHMGLSWIKVFLMGNAKEVLGKCLSVCLLPVRFFEDRSNEDDFLITAFIRLYFSSFPPLKTLGKSMKFQPPKHPTCLEGITILETVWLFLSMIHGQSKHFDDVTVSRMSPTVPLFPLLNCSNC